MIKNEIAKAMVKVNSHKTNVSIEVYGVFKTRYKIYVNGIVMAQHLSAKECLNALNEIIEERKGL